MKRLSPADEPDAQAGQARALRERVEHHDVGEVRAGVLRACRAAASLPVDLRVALVGEQHEAVLAARARRGARDSRGSRPSPADWRARRDRTRPCGRAARVESASRSGRKPFAGGRVEIDRLALGRDRAGRIGARRTGSASGSRACPGARPTKRFAAMAARNRPSRVPPSTRISLNGSIGRASGSGG